MCLRNIHRIMIEHLKYLTKILILPVRVRENVQRRYPLFIITIAELLQLINKSLSYFTEAFGQIWRLA